jgi:tetratricopeptide (TPR) repeat protein
MVLRIILVLCVLGFLGCDSARNEQYKELSALRERIMEDNINGLFGPAQRDLWLTFSQKAMAFYRAYPSDSSAPSLIFNAAELYFKSNEGDSALMALTLLEEMPTFARKPELLYLRGQVYQMLFLNYDEAEISYLAVVKSYPNHPKAQAAETALSVLTTLNNTLEDSSALLKDSLLYQP